MAQEIADSTLLDTWGSSGTKIEPDISKIIEGWQLGEQPPHEYMNWLQNTFGSKLNHILKNGVASWNNETEYLAGSSVQHNGNVWLCKTTNTNSEPTDVNSNWKRIITVESLTTVLNGYVATTGDQDIDNIKTFLKSPIVPTPTSETQVANKAYVDNKSIPTGLISMWSGSTATIPSGWALCDGANGTPNLQDRFVIGAGSAYAVGTTGGSKDAIVVSHTHTQEAHNHTATTSSAGAHTHTYTALGAGSFDGGGDGNYEGMAYGTKTTSSAGAHTHTLTTNTVTPTINSTGSNGTNANLPPYYALAYIMKI